MKIPKVSVIIPVYDGERTLKRCLDSVLAQEYKDYEVIVVDNNSSDNTREIIIDYSRIRCFNYVFEKKRGRGAARKTGEKNASGDIILMTDSDCILPKYWIKEMIRPFKNKDVKAVQGFQEGASEGFWSQQIQAEMNSKYLGNDLLIGKNIIGMIDTKNFAIRGETLRKIGYSSEHCFSGNDTDLSIKLAKGNTMVKFLKDVKVKHHHPDKLLEYFKKQISRAKWTFILCKDNKQYLKNTFFFEQTNQTLKSFFLFFPGVLFNSVRNPKKGYFDLFSGTSWRLGLILGILDKKVR